MDIVGPRTAANIALAPFVQPSSLPPPIGFRARCYATLRLRRDGGATENLRTGRRGQRLHSCYNA